MSFQSILLRLSLYPSNSSHQVIVLFSNHDFHPDFLIILTITNTDHHIGMFHPVYQDAFCHLSDPALKLDTVQSRAGANDDHDDYDHDDHDHDYDHDHDDHDDKDDKENHCQPR